LVCVDIEDDNVLEDGLIGSVVNGIVDGAVNGLLDWSVKEVMVEITHGMGSWARLLLLLGSWARLLLLAIKLES